MKVLITGANGFLGKNLIDRLNWEKGIKVLPYHHTESRDLLAAYCREADFVFHLASVCRPKDPAEFKEGNVDYLKSVLSALEEAQNKCPVLLTSSIQAGLEGRYAYSIYGITKRQAEELLMAYGSRTGARVMYYRLPHLFGKWGTPNYNNVLHTFCFNVAHGLPIRVDDPSVELPVVWVEDLLDDMLLALRDSSYKGRLTSPFVEVSTVGQVAELLQQFAVHAVAPQTPFEHKLYNTFITYK